VEITPSNRRDLKIRYLPVQDSHYSTWHEDVPNKESVIRLLDILPVFYHSEKDHNIVDKKNPITNRRYINEEQPIIISSEY